MALKPWQKIGISLVTVGITATTVYFGYKAIKKHLAKKAADKAETDKSQIKVVKQPTVHAINDKVVDHKAQADLLATQIKKQYDFANKTYGGVTAQDNKLIQAWNTELLSYGYYYDNGKAVKK